MSAEPRDSMAQAIDAAVDRATRELRQENDGLSVLNAQLREANLALRREMNEVIEAYPSAEAIVSTVARERAEIMRILEYLTTEWRPAPGESGRDGGNPLIRRHPVVSSAGVVQIPSNVASPAEVWILERAMARIRART